MLVIIDVQKRYPASKKVLPQVLQEIRKAKRCKEQIVLVMFGYKERSLPEIYKMLKGVKYLRINKDDTDGGTAIFSSLVKCDKANNLGAVGIRFASIRKLRVCGVNTSACVMCTVETLSKLRIPVQVISKACANGFDKMSEEYNLFHHKTSLRLMKAWKNVEVI